VPGVPEDRQPKDVQRLQAGRVLWQGGAEDGLARAQDCLQSRRRHHETSRDQARHREGKKQRGDEKVYVLCTELIFVRNGAKAYVKYPRVFREKNPRNVVLCNLLVTPA
jgi:hypothetical protein